MSYKKPEIWSLARELVIEVHKMTFTLPKFEQFGEAQQIRRSIKSVKSNIVDGYGRRRDNKMILLSKKMIKFLKSVEVNHNVHYGITINKKSHILYPVTS